MEFVGFYKNDKTGEISPYPSWRDLFKWPERSKISWRLNPKQEIILTSDEAKQYKVNPNNKSAMLINGTKIPIRVI